MIGPARRTTVAAASKVYGAFGLNGRDASQHQPPVVPSGDFMATAAAIAPSAPLREDFATLLEESFGHGNLQEGSVVKGPSSRSRRISPSSMSASRPKAACRCGNSPSRPRRRAQGRRSRRRLCRAHGGRATARPCCRATRRGARRAGAQLEKAFQANERVDGIIFGRVKGGFTVDLGGAVAFLPRRQVDIRPVRDVDPLMGSRSRSRSSRWTARAATSSSRAAPCSKRPARSSAPSWWNLEEGQVLDGVVKNITDYGAFVDLGGIDGLLHVTDIAWRRVNHPSEVLQIGQHGQGAGHPLQPRDASASRSA